MKIGCLQLRKREYNDEEKRGFQIVEQLNALNVDIKQFQVLETKSPFINIIYGYEGELETENPEPKPETINNKGKKTEKFKL